LLKALHEPLCPPPDLVTYGCGQRRSTLIPPCRSSPDLLSLPFFELPGGSHSNEPRIMMMLFFSCVTKL
jgi:hypothetical protein